MIVGMRSGVTAREVDDVRCGEPGSQPGIGGGRPVDDADRERLGLQAEIERDPREGFDAVPCRDGGAATSGGGRDHGHRDGPVAPDSFGSAIQQCREEWFVSGLEFSAAVERDRAAHVRTHGAFRRRRRRAG